MSSYRLVTLVDVSSQEMMDWQALVCPLCGAPARPAWLRAGLAAFVAAAVCDACGCICRAAGAFSLDAVIDEDKQR